MEDDYAKERAFVIIEGEPFLSRAQKYRAEVTAAAAAWQEFI